MSIISEPISAIVFKKQKLWNNDCDSKFNICLVLLSLAQIFCIFYVCKTKQPFIDHFFSCKQSRSVWKKTRACFTTYIYMSFNRNRKELVNPETNHSREFQTNCAASFLWVCLNSSGNHSDKLHHKNTSQHNKWWPHTSGYICLLLRA